MKSAGICCGVKPYFFKVFLSFKYEINLALSRNKQDETFLAKSFIVMQLLNVTSTSFSLFPLPFAFILKPFSKVR